MGRGERGGGGHGGHVYGDVKASSGPAYRRSSGDCQAVGLRRRGGMAPRRSGDQAKNLKVVGGEAKPKSGKSHI